jgi:1-acyl-sn-glycerol-3-phosphate acyltransferase
MNNKIRQYPLYTKKNSYGFLDIATFGVTINLLGLMFLFRIIFLKNDFKDAMKYFLKVVCQSKIKVKTKKRLDNKADIYLVNHTTCGDFFVDPIVTNSSCGISRKLVFLAIVFPSLYCLIYNKIKFISVNKDSFGYVLRRCIEEKQKVFYYPEGSRNPKKEKLMLRQGGLREIYNKRLKVQIVISYNKDKLFDEFKKEIHKDVVVYTYYSELIDSNNYVIFDDFFNEIQRIWDQMYIIKK